MIMDFSEVYKKILQNRGGSILKSNINNTEFQIINSFKYDPSYRLAKNITKDLIYKDLDIRVINDDKSITNKEFYLLPHTKTTVGDYIIYDLNDNEKTPKIYIIKEIEDNLISPCARGEICNRLLKFKNIPKEFKNGFPCRVKNDGYGSKLLSDNELFTMDDEKCNITVQANKYTLGIRPNTRFMFLNNKNAIFKVFSINVAFRDGTVTFICKKDLYREGLDDLENNIAWQPDYIEQEINSQKIYGDTSIKINEIKEYKIDANINKWEISDKSIADIVEETPNSCKIKGLKENSIFILKAISDTDVVIETLIATEK